MPKPLPSVKRITNLLAAQGASVSAVTVNRVIRGYDAPVAEATRARVVAAVDQLGGDIALIPAPGEAPIVKARPTSPMPTTEAGKKKLNAKRRENTRHRKHLSTFADLAGMSEQALAEWLDAEHPDAELGPFEYHGIIKLFSTPGHDDRIRAAVAMLWARLEFEQIESIWALLPAPTVNYVSQWLPDFAVDMIPDAPAPKYTVTCPFCGKKWDTAPAPNARHGHGCAKEAAAEKAAAKPATPADAAPRTWERQCVTCLDLGRSKKKATFTATHHLADYCDEHS